MSSRYRLFFSRFNRFTVSFRPVTISGVRFNPKRNMSLPCALGFTMFTWLGFEKKLSAEDDLIHTIKHCVLFIQQTEYEKAEQLLHVALRQAQQIQHQLGITYIYDLMANLALERQQLEKAKNLFVNVSQRIMADGAKEDDSRVVHISIKLARISHLMKDYNTAQLGYDWCLEKLSKAVSYEPTEGTKLLLALTEDWYGRLFVDCNQCEQGLKLMTNSLNHMNEISNIEPEHIIIQLNDLGTICDRLGKLDESIDYFSEAIKLSKKLPEGMPELGATYINLGRVYLKKNMLEEARKNCGYGWKLGVSSKNYDIKSEGTKCLHEINNIK